MRIKEVYDNTKNIKADEETKSALLNIIDNKIESDMKEFTSEIRSLRNEIKIIYWVIGIAMAIIILMLNYKK